MSNKPHRSLRRSPHHTPVTARLSIYQTVLHLTWPTLTKSVLIVLICSGERQKLYKHWNEELRETWLAELKHAMREFERVRDDQRRIHADVDLNVLRGARLVGMTTAGVASKQELVAAMSPKVPALLVYALRGFVFGTSPKPTTVQLC